jgi:MAternally-affected-uncoordination protein
LDRNTNELQTTMQPCAALIEEHQTTNLYQVESLKVFFLILQVTYFLQSGQMKSVRNTLKSLQHYVQLLSSRNEEGSIV